MTTRCGPQELINIGADPAAFVKFGRNEYHGPCPACGGDDRFVVFTDGEYPHWNYFCRVCRPDGGWIDEINPGIKEKLSPEERVRRAAEHARRQEESLKAEIQRAQEALRELQEARSWLHYHEQLTQEASRLWVSWGVPEYWQGFWKLGYDPDRVIWTGSTSWRTPTMTIPIFEPGTWECLNVRHRLLNPPTPGDKYRPERSGLPAALFVADPDNPVAGTTLCVEGEKKAMVTFLTADDPCLQVVGLPGKNPSSTLLAKLSECDPVYVCLDPDAEAGKIVEELGTERCRVLDLPGKIDDLIIDGLLDREGLRKLMRTSRRL